jgi:hypothetical protein
MTTIVKIGGPFSWYILARCLLHVSIFCFNIPNVGPSQTETCILGFLYRASSIGHE